MASEQQAREQEVVPWVVQSRLKQGLPEHIEDPAVLAQLIVLLGLTGTDVNDEQYPDQRKEA